MKNFLAFILLLITTFYANAQPDRFTSLEEKLHAMATDQKGLNEKVDFSVSGATIQEFLSGIAASAKLNINVDPRLNIVIHNNFTNENVLNILMFIAREYDLDIRFTGSILSFYKYLPPPEIVNIIPKNIRVAYDSSTNKLSMDLRNDSLQAVTRKLTQLTDHNVIVSPGLLNRFVSVYIEDLPFENALEKMCFANNLELSKTADNVFVIQNLEQMPTDLKVNLQQKQQGNVRQNDLSKDIAIQFKDSLGYKFIDLNVFNTPLADVIQLVCERAGISYFLYSKIEGNTTTKVYHLSFDELLTYLFKGTPYTYRVDQKIFFIGLRQIEGLRASKVFQFQYRSIDIMIESIPADLKKDVEIKEFRELNSVLLTGSQPQINEVETFFKSLDKIVPLIYIEVIMLDVQKGKSISTGIKVGTDSVKTGGTIFPGLDFKVGSNSINKFINFIGLNKAVNIGPVGPSFYASISALEENNNVNVHSIPKLSTLNGHEAKLSIGSTRYYSQQTQNTIPGNNPNTITTQTYHAVNADMVITIKPIVSGDNQVTMNIEIKISDFTGTPPPNAPPPTATSEYKSILRVHSDEMIALGGIERTEQSESGSGVPILSRIPILKWLFSSRTKSSKKVTSIVFIKPSIIL